MSDPLIERFAREDDAEAAMDAAAKLPPDLFYKLSAMFEDEVQLNKDGSQRIYGGEPVPFYLEPGLAVALAELATAVGLRPDQYLEQLIKRHLKSSGKTP